MGEPTVKGCRREKEAVAQESASPRANTVFAVRDTAPKAPRAAGSQLPRHRPRLPCHPEQAWDTPPKVPAHVEDFQPACFMPQVHPQQNTALVSLGSQVLADLGHEHASSATRALRTIPTRTALEPFKAKAGAGRDGSGGARQATASHPTSLRRSRVSSGVLLGDRWGWKAGMPQAPPRSPQQADVAPSGIPARASALDTAPVLGQQHCPVWMQNHPWCPCSLAAPTCHLPSPRGHKQGFIISSPPRPLRVCEWKATQYAG